MAVFQQKHYNAEAWGKYKEYLLQLKANALLVSGAVGGNAEVAKAMASQTGTLSATLPYFSDGTEDTAVQNYDGATDIVPVKLTTYSQTFGGFGRAKAWTETDFSTELTTANTVNAIYARLANWVDYAVEQPAVLAILRGLFAPNADQTQKTAFITDHTSTVTTVTPEALNNALEKAVGDKKDSLGLFVCHSRIATQLENLQLINYVPYTNSLGVQTDTKLRYWNGRLLLVDNSVNTNAGAGEYIGYALGTNVITMQPLPVTHPIEPTRDPKKNGGQDELIIRNRYGFGAKGMNFKVSGAVNYSNADLADGDNWSLISDATNTHFVPADEIPIAKLVYKPA